MLGAILSLGFTAFFGANSIIARRGVLRTSPNYLATVSIFSGPIFFLLIILATGDLLKILGFNWQVISFFAISGIIHFFLGRTFNLKSTQLIGATRSGVVSGLNAILSVVLAVIILKETITPLMIIGILISLSGPILIAQKEEKATRSAEQFTHPQMKSLDSKTLFHGLYFGTAAAILWGSSPIFIKFGLDNGGSPLAGIFIAYCAASLIVGVSLISKSKRIEIFKTEKQPLGLALILSLTTNIAQMLRYLALNYGTVIIVSLVGRVIPIWTILLSYIFNRQVESFSCWVIVGNALLVLGTVLVLL